MTADRGVLCVVAFVLTMASLAGRSTAMAPPEPTPATAPATGPASQVAPSLTRCTLAGSEGGLWLLQLDPDGQRYDLLTKGVSRKWVRLARGAARPPAIFIPVGAQAHLLSADAANHTIVSMQANSVPAPAPLPMDPHWPAGATIVAGCGAYDFPAGGGFSAVVLVARPGDSTSTAPATSGPVADSRPVAADARPRVLGVLVFSQQGGWRYVTDVPASLWADGCKTFAVVNQGRLVVLTAGETLHVGVWHKGAWTVSPLPADVATFRAVTLAIVQKQSVIVARGPVAEGASEAPLTLVTLDAAGAVAATQLLRRDTGPAMWALDAPLLAAQFGKQLAILDQPTGAETVQLSVATLDGKLTDPEAIAALADPGQGRGQQILQWFLWGLFGLVIFCVVIRRPSAPPSMFALPPRARPGALAKRALAAAIDLAPMVIVMSAIFSAAAPVPEGLINNFEDLRAQMSDDSELARLALATADKPTVAAGLIAAMLGYGLYCVLMEVRYGATIGKMLLGLRVVDETGSPPDLRSAAIRNLTRLIIVLELFPLGILLLFPLLNANRQRLGDMMARTAVIDRKLQSSPPPAPYSSPDDDTQAPS